MAITAKLNYLRMSPRKVRLVVDAIRGMDADEAGVYLERSSKRAAMVVGKLLKSAVANAEHDFQKDPSLLYVQTISVDGGPILKRFRSRAFGRASDIHKHTSHITLILGERETARKKRFAVERTSKPKTSETLEEMSHGKKDKESEFGLKGAKKEKKGVQKKVTDISKRFFRRKSV
jgi:large subunit ribosomal protein L22